MASLSWTRNPLLPFQSSSSHQKRNLKARRFLKYCQIPSGRQTSGFTGRRCSLSRDGHLPLKWRDIFADTAITSTDCLTSRLCALLSTTSMRAWSFLLWSIWKAMAFQSNMALMSRTSLSKTETGKRQPDLSNTSRMVKKEKSIWQKMIWSSLQTAAAQTRHAMVIRTMLLIYLSSAMVMANHGICGEILLPRPRMVSMAIQKLSAVMLRLQTGWVLL